ncbi:hypothetical protein AVEN_127775-1 [Araneus ventricosus]|uniref:Uncharacterized protein n=1 Tax=Araneus ventricosus TaxID=182803 RepID=A0A4Y2M813_ARAVE|nr:hypothetical protein AVEN_127775-1 [Araneus ventricosus]
MTVASPYGSCRHNANFYWEIYLPPPQRDRVGLEERCLLWSRKVPGSKPKSTENPSCIGPDARKIIRREPNVLPLTWHGSLERELPAQASSSD